MNVQRSCNHVPILIDVQNPLHSLGDTTLKNRLKCSRLFRYLSNVGD